MAYIYSSWSTPTHSTHPSPINPPLFVTKRCERFVAASRLNYRRADSLPPACRWGEVVTCWNQPMVIFWDVMGYFFRNEKMGKKKPVGDLAKEAMAQWSMICDDLSRQTITGWIKTCDNFQKFGWMNLYKQQLFWCEQKDTRDFARMMYECEFDVWTVDVCVQVGFGQMVWIDGNQFPVRRHLAACMTHDLRTEVQCIF